VFVSIEAEVDVARQGEKGKEATGGRKCQS